MFQIHTNCFRHGGHTEAALVLQLISTYLCTSYASLCFHVNIYIFLIGYIFIYSFKIYYLHGDA